MLFVTPFFEICNQVVNAALASDDMIQQIEQMKRPFFLELNWMNHY